jgi:hypothetical protein
VLPRPTAHWRNCTEPRERAGQLFCIMSVRVTSKSVNARLHYEAIDCELRASERIAVRRQRFSTRTEDAIRQHFALAPGTCSGKMRYGARARRRFHQRARSRQRFPSPLALRPRCACVTMASELPRNCCPTYSICLSKGNAAPIVHRAA